MIISFAYKTIVICSYILYPAAIDRVATTDGGRLNSKKLLPGSESLPLFHVFFRGFSPRQAGPVSYCTDSFLDKNRDQLSMVPAGGGSGVGYDERSNGETVRGDHENLPSGKHTKSY